MESKIEISILEVEIEVGWRWFYSKMKFGGENEDELEMPLVKLLFTCKLVFHTNTDLRHSTSKQWDETKLNCYLSQENVRHIYISHQHTYDELVWHYTKNGVYSVKLGYWQSTHLLETCQMLIQPPQGNPLLKTRIWKTIIPPKLKHFLR